MAVYHLSISNSQQRAALSHSKALDSRGFSRACILLCIAPPVFSNSAKNQKKRKNAILCVCFLSFRCRCCLSIKLNCSDWPAFMIAFSHLASISHSHWPLLSLSPVALVGQPWLSALSFFFFFALIRLLFSVSLPPPPPPPPLSLSPLFFC